jgi:hypothetical protein
MASKAPKKRRHWPISGVRQPLLGDVVLHCAHLVRHFEGEHGACPDGCVIKWTYAPKPIVVQRFELHDVNQERPETFRISFIAECEPCHGSATKDGERIEHQMEGAQHFVIENDDDLADVGHIDWDATIRPPATQADPR